VSSEVGAGHVSIFPVFKGMRSAVRKEVDGAVTGAAASAEKGFADTGRRSGTALGKGLKSAVESSTKDLAGSALKTFERDVARTSAAVARARLSEADAAGKVRVAEKQLADARSRYSSDSAQVIGAEEKLAASVRRLESAQDNTKSSTDDLRAAQSKLADAADNAGDQMAQAGRRSGSRFGDGFKSVFAGSFFGTTFAGLASSAISGVGRLIGTGIRNGIEGALQTIDIASSLNESVNAVRVSYGAAADAVLLLGENSARSFGISKRELNQFATQFSGFARTIRADNPAGFIEELTARASDFASVFNINVSDALQLFQSGLAGETEPLRRFGIDLSAASVEAFAYAKGIAESGVELTEAQKQQARYAYLLEQTGIVQGDFANTADELANKNRINAAVWDDLQAKIGTAFLPMAERAAGFISDTLLPALDTFITVHGPGMAAAFEDAGPAIADLVDNLLPKLPGLFEDLGSFLPGAIEGVSGFIDEIIETVDEVETAVDRVTGFFDTINGEIEANAERAREFDATVASAWNTELQENEQRWATFGQNVATGWQGIVAQFEAGGQTVASWGSAWDAEVAENEGRWSNFGSQVGNVWSGITGAFGNGAAQIGSFFGTIGGHIQTGAGRLGAFFGQVGQNVNAGIGAFGRFAGGIGSAIGQGIGHLGAFAGAVGARIGEAMSYIGSLPGRALGALGNVGGILFNAGSRLIGGFVDGIRSMIGAVGNAVSGVVSWARGFFPSSPAKRGPLSGAGWRKLRESGEAVMEQWTAGMGSTSVSPTISTALSRVVAAQGQWTASAAVARSQSVSTTLGTGDTIMLNGITTRAAGEEIAEHIETKKRRRLYRTGALTTVGVG
jgi:uncharacterized protein YukE